MAEGPYPAAQQFSSDQSSCQEEEPAITDPNVTCGHCKEELTNPYLLCCLHSVCAECLPEMVLENGYLKCNQCGDTSTVRTDGKTSENECRVDSVRCFPAPNGPLARYIEGSKVAELLKETTIPCGSKTCQTTCDPSVVFCVNCSMYLCSHCRDSHKALAYLIGSHTMKTLDEVRTLGPLKSQVFISKNTNPISCPKHSGKFLEYFCERCGLGMCQACTVDYKSTHLPLFIDDNVFENFTKSVQIAHHTAVDYEQQCEKIGKNLHAQITELSELKEEILSSINTAFQSIYDAVDERKAKLCGEVTATIDNIHKILNSKLTTAQKEKAISVDSQSVLQFVVSHGDGHDVTASKDVVLAHQSVLTSKWLHPELHSTVSQVMTFDQANQDALLKAITEFGIIQAGACPANCILNRKPEDITTKDSNPVQLIVTTFDHENVQCKIGGEKVEAFLCPKFPIPGPAIKAKVVDNKNGKYTITFSLTYRGVCDLSIHVNGNGISNSPFTVFLQPIHDILPEIQENVIVVGTDKTYESYDGGRAVSISVVPNGYTYMVDYDRHLVYVYDRYRRHVRSFGEPGRAYGRILSATGIAVDSKGLVYVSSCFNDRIVVHKQNGTFHAEICHRSHPLDIKIHKDHLYVVNEDRNRIQVYSLNDSNPPIKPVIGSEGSGPGQFMSIRKITFSPDGDMYVTDRVKHCVQVFTSDGEYKRMFGRDNLQSPGETVITNRGYVLVSEYPNNIAVFNTVGQLVQFFSADSHYHIECLAIDHNGDLLVPLDNRKIVVFQFHSNFK